MLYLLNQWEFCHDLAGTFANLINFLFMLFSNSVALEVCPIRPAFLFIESGGNLPTNWGKSGMNRKNSCLSVSHALDAWGELKSENSFQCFRSYHRNITNGNFKGINVLWETEKLGYCSFVTPCVCILDRW